MTTDQVPEWVEEKLQEDEFLRQQMTVTLGDYQDAVVQLVSVAGGEDEDSGAEVAAQILLSLYSSAFPCDLTGLLKMDPRNQLAALTAIKGRLSTYKEPHTVIVDGTAVFDELKRRWRDSWKVSTL